MLAIQSRRALDRFIAASDTRIQKRRDLENARTQPEKEAANKQCAVASMARGFASGVEPELLALLSPRYEGASTGTRGRIYFTIENKNFYIICDPFLKNGDVQAGWFGVTLGDGNQQLALLQFTGESFQDDLLQAIRHAPARKTLKGGLDSTTLDATTHDESASCKS